MPKFREKPIVVEAFQWLGDNPFLLGLWVSHVDPYRHYIHANPIQEGGLLQIHTLEGVMLAQPGDWIIQGIKGELYPCKPDIFDATYEEVHTSESPPAEEQMNWGKLVKKLVKEEPARTEVICEEPGCGGVMFNTNHGTCKCPKCGAVWY